MKTHINLLIITVSFICLLMIATSCDLPQQTGASSAGSQINTASPTPTLTPTLAPVVVEVDETSVPDEIIETAYIPEAELNALNRELRVIINDQAFLFGAYNIYGNNYIKLNDLAFALNDTIKRFYIGWRGGLTGSIDITTGMDYSAIGDEMRLNEPGDREAEPRNQVLNIDQRPVMLEAYIIDGAEFFWIQDLGRELGFGITWDDSRNAVIIEIFPEIHLGRDIRAYQNDNVFEYPARGSFTISGNTYSSGIVSSSGRAFYIINGEYASVSGIYGPVDNTLRGSSRIRFYGDGRFLNEITSSAGSLAQTFSINVSGVTQLTLDFSGDGNHALANVLLSNDLILDGTENNVHTVRLGIDVVMSQGSNVSEYPATGSFTMAGILLKGKD